VTAPPVEAPRADLELLLSLALADLAASWVTGPAEAVRDALAATLPDLVALYGSAAATLGADWYDDFRADALAPGRFRAIPAELPDQGRFDSLVGWGTQPLWPSERTFEDDDGNTVTETVEPDPELARSRVAGGFQRIVADAHRDTIIGSLAADPAGKGWRRQTTGGSCKFCVRIAGRGAVYSARTARFSSHDDCDCIAVPEFGEAVKVLPYVPSQRFRSQSSRDANNARVREFLRTT
jgi:hypothetical protein